MDSAHSRGRAFLFILSILACGIILGKGVLPAFQSNGGDFANYYTASRLLVDGISLQKAYSDFSWFQQQMDRYGIENQAGGFIPQPPPTALVFVPLSFFEALTAKRMWTVVNVALMVLAIFLLARTSGLHWLITAVLFFGTGYGLLNNFLFGQLYLAVLVSILLPIYFLEQGKPRVAGLWLGSLSPVKYVGILFLLFFAWKKQWKLVLTATATVLVLIVVVLWIDYPAFETFVLQVLPRHLKGEIQDPYAVSFQSWNSLYRRLFRYEATLNPTPALVSPFLFFLCKNLTFWILAASALFMMTRSRFPNPQHQRLFQMGWIPLAMLLLSPGTATYHFLLLSLSAVFFVKILVDRGKTLQAIGMAVLYAAINLPHHIKLEALAVGRLNPLSYTRLWFLLIFFMGAIFLFRSCVKWNRKRLLLFLPLLGLLSGFNTVLDYVRFRGEPRDGAQELDVYSSGPRHYPSLLRQGPDLGRERIVFSELLDDHYGIFSTQGESWTPGTSRNYYRPDLASDDAAMLVETVAHGGKEIWWREDLTKPLVFLTRGATPSWRPDGGVFAFERAGKLHLFDVVRRVETMLAVAGECYDPTYSPQGDSLVYCVREGDTTGLRSVDLSTFEIKVLFGSRGRIETPVFSGDATRVVFSLEQEGGQDLWALDLVKDRTMRLTWDSALDRDPVWDEARSRIVFVSDRRRGLGCTTLYWIPIPEELR